MKTDCSSKHIFGGASGLTFGRIVCSAVAVVLLLSAVPAEAQYNSGSSGIHGVFPPPQTDGTVPGTANIVWNMRTGGVRYCSTYTIGTGSDQCDANSSTDVFVQIPGTAGGGPPNGVYEFTNVNVVGVTGFTRRLIIVGTSSNVPLSILSQGDIRLLPSPGSNSLQLFINGQTPPVVSDNFAAAGGKGGPGGFDGALSGNGGEIPEHGGTGFGPTGGTGGRADAQTAEALNAAGAGVPPVNQSLTPLSGGSGGGGAAGVSGANTLNCGTTPLGYGGGPGGGGGGALLLAASNSVTIGSFVSILAHGGTGSRNNVTNCGLFGGGGGGGSVRIVAQEFTGAGTIDVRGGTRNNGLSPAAGGVVRIETAINTFTGNISGASGGSFLSFPTTAVPTNQPQLHVVSIAGQNAPTNPSASLAVPDITFASAIEAPVTVNIAANNVPLGTTVNVRVVPSVGQPTNATSTALAGTLASSTATATVTLPPGPGILTASATFTVGGSGGGGAASNMLPMIDGRRPERMEVATLADGRSRTYLVSHSGVRFEVGTLTR